MPQSREEAVEILASDSIGDDRGLHTPVRLLLLKREVIGICSGRKGRNQKGILTEPIAYLVPYPHTSVLAEMMADRVWEVVESS